ncbi:MAG: endonuclease III domain-containing protein [Gammaproteobacteria bacterium]|nr:endonuclease III domain-containing protein [Gammaproteobacteria bacterium]
MKTVSLKKIYKNLFSQYGPQNWWPGETPFEIMVGAVLTQNTAWTNVEKAIANLIEANALAPDIIVGTHPKRLASWLKPSGYFNIKAKRLKNYCRWYLQQGEYETLDQLPTDELRASLLSVNGVGPETADDILLYAFNRPVFIIDAYTRRLFKRLGHIDGDEHYESLREFFQQGLSREKDIVQLFNEYHALIVIHAKDYCKTKPRCEDCCLQKECDFKTE